MGSGRPPEPTEVLAPGEYSLQGPQVFAAINRGEGPQALAYYERTAALAEQQGDAVRAGRAWSAASIVAYRLGQYQKAIQVASRAIALFAGAQKLSEEAVVAWATAYSHLGASYRVVGDYPRARQALTDGLTLCKDRLSGRRAGNFEGVLMTGLARVALAQQDYPTALTYSTQAAQYFEDSLSNMPRASDATRTSLHRYLSDAYWGMGRAQLALGHPDEADAAVDRGLKHARLSGLREVESDLLAIQGMAALARQDWAKALASYQRALGLANQVHRSSTLPVLNYGLARAQAGLGHTDDALAAARDAVRAVEELRAGLGDAESRSGFVEDKQAIYHLAVRLALAAQRPAEAFEVTERGRARAFLDLLGNQTTLSKGRTRALVAEEVRLRARLAEATAEVEDTDASGDAAQVRGSVEAANREYRAFLDRVRTESLEQASLMSVEPVTLAEIQGLLPEGTTLLEYLVGNNDTVVWAVERQGMQVVRIPGDRPSLVAEVRAYRTAIARQAPLPQIHAAAEQLYRRLLQPIRDSIHGKRVVIVPHDVLHYLPFNALRAPDGRWTVEEFALSTLPSASVLRFLDAKAAGASERALVVGNPDLGPALALPWAEREARLVGQQQQHATVLVEGDATEAQVKRLIEGAGLVHFATHGELDEADPLASALLLVGGDGEDGRLEVRELFGLDLHARLVILSACQTGLGKLSRGDELVGLQRAFLYAGTPAVVTTLWQVDDRASYELIRAFYAHLGSAGPVDALRLAQVETLRTYPHPFLWAAFGLTGVSR